MSRDRKMEIIMNIVFLVIGFIAGYFTSYYFYRKSEFLSHQMIPREFPKLTFPAIIFIGDNPIIASPGTRIAISNVTPFTVEAKKDGSILIWGDIYDYRGYVVGLLRGSSLQISPGSRYDINADARAIEVVNEKLQPVFQIWKASDQEMKTAEKNLKERQRVMKDFGMLTEDDATLFKIMIEAFSRHEVLMSSYVNYHRSENDKNAIIVQISDSQGTITTRNLQSVKQRINGIKRLFEYPGNKYPGVRRRD
jgi:hypothetical protein